MKKLPDSICDLNHLENLWIDHNQLEALPRNFGKLKILKLLQAGYNKIFHLPDSIIQLLNLQNLNLEQKYITSLPINFISLVNLREINVRLNDISFDNTVKSALQKNGCHILEGKSIFRKNQIKMN